MGFFDFIKKRENENIKAKYRSLHARWTHMIHLYNSLFQDYDKLEQKQEDCTVYLNNMYETINEETYKVGLAQKTVYNDETKTPVYEFIVPYINEDDQVDSRYYSLESIGDLDQENGLVTFNIDFIAGSKEKPVPCTTTIYLNTKDLQKINEEKLNTITKEIGSNAVSKKYQPQIDDIRIILNEFAKINNLKINTTSSQSEEDYIPGN